jgi:hypothetical protein
MAAFDGLRTATSATGKGRIAPTPAIAGQNNGFPESKPELTLDR